MRRASKNFGRKDPHAVPVERRQAEAVLYGRDDMAQEPKPNAKPTRAPIDGTPQEPMMGDRQKIKPGPIEPRDYKGR